MLLDKAARTISHVICKLVHMHYLCCLTLSGSVVVRYDAAYCGMLWRKRRNMTECPSSARGRCRVCYPIVHAVVTVGCDVFKTIKSCILAVLANITDICITQIPIKYLFQLLNTV